MKKLSEIYPELNAETLAENKVQTIFHPASGEPMGFEGWKQLSLSSRELPPSQIVPGGPTRQLILNSGKPFNNPSHFPPTAWSSPYMFAACSNHHNCTAENFCAKPGCHKGDPELNDKCTCGIYSYGDYDQAATYGSNDLPYIVRLANFGKMFKGPMGVRSRETILTGIVMPEIPAWFQEHADLYREAIKKLSKTYRIPILGRGVVQPDKELGIRDKDPTSGQMLHLWEFRPKSSHPNY